MKIDKKLIKELVDNLKEFELDRIRISRRSNKNKSFKSFKRN